MMGWVKWSAPDRWEKGKTHENTEQINPLDLGCGSDFTAGRDCPGGGPDGPAIISGIVALRAVLTHRTRRAGLSIHPLGTGGAARKPFGAGSGGLQGVPFAAGSRFSAATVRVAPDRAVSAQSACTAVPFHHDSILAAVGLGACRPDSPVGAFAADGLAEPIHCVNTAVSNQC